ncbi:hypothetical protein ES705_28259 [subsurface metagenome]
MIGLGPGKGVGTPVSPGNPVNCLYLLKATLYFVEIILSLFAISISNCLTKSPCCLTNLLKLAAIEGLILSGA